MNKSIRSFYWLKVLTWPLSLCSALPRDLANIIPAQNYSTIVKTLQEWTRYPIREILSGVFPSYSGVDQFRLEHKQDSLSDSSGPHFRRLSSSHSMFNLTRVKNIHQSQDQFVIDVYKAGLHKVATHLISFPISPTFCSLMTFSLPFLFSSLSPPISLP